MKKKVLLLVMLSLFVVGVVQASSINGEFKGNAVVKVYHEGKELQVEDVPAILYEGRTMVPVYLFKQLGVELVWDLEKVSVDVKLPKAPAATPTTPAATSKNDKDFMVFLGKYANAYKLTGDLAEFLKLNYNFLALYFNAHNQNLSTAYTDQEVVNRLTEVGETMDKRIEYIKTMYDPTSYDGKGIDALLADIRKSFTTYIDAAQNLLKWRENRYYNNNIAQDAFNTYLNSNGAAHESNVKVKTKADEGYDNYILHLINTK